MTTCFFASDLHGHPDRYLSLFEAITAEKPAAVFLGGDLLPSGRPVPESLDLGRQDFIADFVEVHLRRLQENLGPRYPRIFLILGNDDPRAHEAALSIGARRGTWEYVHERRVSFGGYDVYGYACVPPTPFQLKDWERYDVSQYVDPGCIPPEEGRWTVPVAEHLIRHATMKEDLQILVGRASLDKAIFLFHSPPYQTALDRAALDGKSIDHVPLDVHVGSIAIRRFIEARRPLITLHGHVHESARLTGDWRQQVGPTWCYTAAHDGPELALVRFDPSAPELATRELL